MRDFMGGEIAQHKRRRENKPPRIREHAGRRTGAPTARLIAHRHALDVDAKGLRRAPARSLEIALGFALEIIAYPASQMRRRPGDTKKRHISAGLNPDRAAHARAVVDAVLHAAQREYRAMCERHGVRKPPQTG